MMGLQVAENVTALGVESWPLLSSWPHPVEFMQWMREAFAQPEVFTAQVLTFSSGFTFGFDDLADGNVQF